MKETNGLLFQPSDSLGGTLEVPFKLLMGAGPSNPYPRVLQALSQPILGPLQPETFKIMDEIKEGLRYVFQTKNELTLAVSASGNGGMETTLCNLLEEGDTALFAVNGIWAQRATTMAERYGARVVTIEALHSFTLSQLEQALDKYRPTLLFITQGESSAGVLQQLQGVGDLCRRFQCLLVVDSVASSGAVPLFMDLWGIDAIYSGTQKVLGSVCGLAPVSFSPRAVEKILQRKTPPKSFYLDIMKLGVQWGCFGKVRQYHHTTSSPLLLALRESLAIIAEEGLSNVIARHRNCSKRLYEGLEKLQLQFCVEDLDQRLPTVTTVKIPEDIGDRWKDITSYAMQKYRVEIGAGLGPTANKALRIGVMGYNATPEKVDKVLEVLKESLEFARRTRADNNDFINEGALVESLR